MYTYPEGVQVERMWFTTSDGVKLHIVHKGEGKPLIIIPGWSGSAKEYCLNIGPLSEHYHVYILEHRGHGESENPNYGQRLSRLAKDANEFFHSLGVEKAFWLGHSMGCSVLWCYIDLFGQADFEKLILVDEAPFLLANPKDTEAQVREYGGVRMDLWELCNAFGESWEEGSASFGRYFNIGLFPESPERQYIYDQVAQVQAISFLHKLLRDHLNQDWRDVIQRIVVPTMLMSGDVSHATTEECCKWMVSVIKDCKWDRFPGVGTGSHHMMMNSPEKFNRDIIDFLG